MKRPRFWVLSIMVLLMIVVLPKGVRHESKVAETKLQSSQVELINSIGVETLASSQSNLKLKGVKDNRFARLRQGINTSGWFAQAPLTPDHFRTRVTAKDIQLIKNMGFRHVRFPLDPNVLFNEGNPESLNPKNLHYLDQALDMILAQHLAVIVDLHADTAFKKRLYKDAAFVNTVARFWRSLAQHLSTRSPELVFLEVLNEPDAKNPQEWYAVQRQLLAAMRTGAPKHTLIAASNIRVGNEWDSIKGLEVMTPVEDPNVVYNFHFYDPMIFTHAGASWGWDVLQYLDKVPYPSSPQAIASILPTIKNEAARRQLQYYGKQRWNAKELEGRISRAAAWAREHKVRLTCNEFGVFRSGVRLDSRIQWIRDVRSLLEKYEIGWSMWDYQGGPGGFGLVIKEKNGKFRPDLKTARALFD